MKMLIVEIGPADEYLQSKVLRVDGTAVGRGFGD